MELNFIQTLIFFVFPLFAYFLGLWIGNRKKVNHHIAGEMMISKDEDGKWISGFHFYADNIEELLAADELTFKVKRTDSIMNQN